MVSKRVGLLTRVSLLALEAGLAVGLAQNAQAGSCGIITGTVTTNCTGPATWNTGTLTNNGTISGGATGIVSPGGGTTLTNNGSITGSSKAIYNSGSIATIINTGTLSSAIVDFYNTGTLALFQNSGVMLGTGATSEGITIVSGSIGTIDNTSTGTISSNTAAIKAAASTIGTIINSGLIISAGSAAINNSASLGLLTNSGRISGGSTGAYNFSIVGTLSNSGTITGRNSTGVGNGGTITLLTNSGIIDGAFAGLSNTGLISTVNNTIGGLIGGTVVVGGNTIAASNGVYNTSTIITLSNAGTISGSNFGIQNTGVITTISNSGLVSGVNRGIYNVGTIGLISDTGTGTISSTTGILSNGAGASIGQISNSGLITAGNVDIVLNGTVGSITNSGAIEVTGAGNVAILNNGSAAIGTLSNSGTIADLASGAVAIFNNGGGALWTAMTNAAGGTIVGAQFGINNVGTIATLSNAGALDGSVVGVANTGLISTLTNLSGGTIGGTVLVTIGTVVSTVVAATGIDSNNKIGTLSNSGVITGTANGILNSGTIGSGAVATGLFNAGSISKVTNSGSIIGGGTTPGQAAIVDDGSIGALTNNSGATILGGAGGIAVDGGVIGTITNNGTISASFGQGDGILIQTLGTVGGSVTSINNTGLITSYDGIYVLNSTLGALVNSGTVVGGLGNVGVFDSGTIGLINNSGSIGGNVDGVLVSSSIYSLGTLINQSGATISSNSRAVNNAGFIGTLSNAGTIKGGPIAIYSGNATINSLTNSGTIVATGGEGIYNNGASTIGTLLNTIGGVIDANVAVQNGAGALLTALTNNGTIGGTIVIGGSTVVAATGVQNGAGSTIGTLTNSGQIIGNANGINSNGTIGTINNTVGGTVIGGSNGVGNGALLTLIANSGLIQGNGGSNLGGIYNPGSIGTIVNNSGGSIVSANDGIWNAGGSIGSIDNSGYITGRGNSAGTGGIVSTGRIGTITNDGTGTIFGENQGVYNAFAGQGTIGLLSNSGIINGVTNGVLNSGTIGTIANSGGTIGGTFVNTIGTVVSTIVAQTGIGNSGSIGSISNSGTIAGSSYGINNSGTIGNIAIASGTVSGAVGILDSGTIGSIGNAGTIIASNTAINAASGAGTIGTLTNSGTIESTGSSDGIRLGGASNTGSIGLLSNSGLIRANSFGIVLDGTVTSITNSGTIISTGITSAAINNNGGNSIGTLTNSGTIADLASPGIGILNNGGSAFWAALINTVGGTIAGSSYGVENVGTLSTLSNAGAIGGSIQGVLNEGLISTLTNLAGGTIGGTVLVTIGTVVSTIAAKTGVFSDNKIGSLSNAGLISSASIAINNSSTIGSLSNSGTILSTGLYGLYVNGSSASIGSVTNTGTILDTSTNNASRGVQVAGGTIGNFDNSGLVKGYDGFYLPSGSIGTLTNESGGSIIAKTNVGVFDSGSIGLLSNSGSIGSPNIAVLAVNGTFSTVINNAGGVISAPTAIEVASGSGIGTLSNAGTITGTNFAIDNLGSIGGTIVNSGLIAGAVSSTEALTFAGGTGGTVGTFTGATGSLTAAGEGTITSTNGLTFASGNLLLNDDINAGSTTVTNSAATVQIDNKISITGNYTQGTTASLIVGVNSATNYGELVGTGAINLANDQVDFDPLNGFAPITGQVYTLASAGTLSASGVSVTVPSGFGDIVKISGNDLLLTVVAWPLGTSITGAVTLGSGTASLTPSGTIAGGPTGILVNGSPTSIVNQGSIQGSIAGISITPTSSVSGLTNSGNISGQTGVKNAGTLAFINNSGTISGSSAAISSTGSIGPITNSGLIAGNITAANPQDLTIAGGNGTVGTVTGSNGSIGAGDIGTISAHGVTFNTGTLVLNDNINVNGGAGSVTNTGETVQLNNPISINGSYSQVPSGQLVIGVTSPTSYGDLIGSGAVNLAGDNVSITPTAGGSLTNGEMLTIAQGNGLSAAGVSVSVPAGYTEVTSIIGNDLVVTVEQLPWPVLTSTFTGPATLNGGSGSLTPSGSIGGGPTGVIVSGNATSLTNQGSITGSLTGVSITPSSTLGGLNNSGNISGQTGVKNSGTLTSIVNSGTISGSSAAISSTGSVGPITNSGLIAGNIIAANPQDLTIAGGTGTVGTVTGPNGSITSGDIGTITAHGVTFNTGTLVLNDNINVNGGAGSVTNTGETLQVNNKISINGSYSQVPSGELVIGVTSPTSYGDLVGSGAVNLAGDNIAVTPTAGGSLTNGEMLTIAQGNGLTATGVSVSVPAGYTEVTSIIGNDLVVTVEQLPWPVLASTFTGPATLSGGTGSLTPTGSIGGGPTGVLVTGNATSLTNQGTIAGSLTGVSITPTSTLGGLNNSGDISGKTGVKNAGTLTFINNSGTISGSSAAISSTGSVGPITNSGLIAGNITAANPQDLTIAGGTGTVGTVTGPNGSIGAGDIGTITAHGVTFNTGTLVLNDNINVNGGAGSVTNTGETVQVNNPISINGSYKQNAGGELVIGVTSPTSYGDLIGSGAVNLAGDNVSITPTAGGSLTNGEMLTIAQGNGLSAAGVSVSVPAGYTEVTSIIGNDLVVTLMTIGSSAFPVSTSITGPATLASGSGTVTPTGTITGGPTGVLVAGNATSLTNQGSITGSLTGVSITPTSTLGGLNNSGDISGQTGVKNSGTLTSIVNSGTISGKTNAIVSTGSVGPITNSGLIAGNIIAANPQDLTIAGGTGGTVGTVTGPSGSIGAGDVGTISAHGVTFSTGTLVMNDDIKVNGGAGTVTNVAETVQLNNKVTIDGNYTQDKAASLVIGVASPTSYGELVGTGNVNLAGDDISIASVDGGTLVNDEVLTIAQGNGLNATGVMVAVPVGYTEVTSIVGNELVVTIMANNATGFPVTGSVTGTQTLTSGANGSVTSTGKISGGNTGIRVTGNAGTLGNAGTVTGTLVGVNTGTGGLAALNNTGTIASTGGGTVTGNGGAVANTGSIATLSNSGVLTGTGGATIGGIGVLNGHSLGSLSNSGGGVIFGNTAAVQNQGGLGVLGNSATLTSQAPTGIHNAATGTVGLLTNTGTIAGVSYGIRNAGVLKTIANTGTITGTSGGTVLGNDAAIVNRDGSIASLSNSGLISGTGGATIGGIGVLNGNVIGTLSNSGGGVISGMTAAVQNQGTLGALGNSATITSKAPTGIHNFADSTIGTVSNTGTIVGSVIGLNNGGTIALLNNAGLIDPPSSSGTALLNTGTIGTLTNSGTLSGPVAIDNTASGKIGNIADTGAILGGIYNASATALTISGASGSSFGVLAGSGSGSGTIASAAGLLFSGGNIALHDNIAVGSNEFTVNGANVQLVQNQTISGNYSQTGGKLSIGVTSTTQYGSFSVSGKASVTGTTIDLIGGGFARGQKYAIVDALGDGKYSDDIAKVLGTTAGLTPTIVLTPTTLYVEFLGPTYQQIGNAYDPTAGRMGATLDHIAAGTSAEAVAFQESILFDINSLKTEHEQGVAIRELAPVQIAPGALSSGNAVLASGAIEQHQLTTAYTYPQGGLEIGSGGYESAIWGQALGGGTDRDSEANAEGYDATHYGIATGVDHQFSDTLFGGASFSWVRTDANGTDAQSGHKLNADSYLFSLYGTYRNGPVFLNGQVAGGWDNFHQEREISFLGARASANFDGAQALARISGGYDFHMNNVTVTPVAGLTWQRSWTDSFSETGAGLADLGIDGHSVGTLEQDIGVKFNSAVKTSFGTLVFDLRTEWVHDYTDGAFPTSGLLGGAPFAVTSARPSADGALITYGATLNRDDNTSFRVEGRSDVRSGYQSHSGVVKVIFGF